MSKTAGVLAQIKTITANCSSSHYFHFHYAHVIPKKISSYRRMSLMKHQCLLFLLTVSLYDETDSTHKALLPSTEILPQGKAFGRLC